MDNRARRGFASGGRVRPETERIANKMIFYFSGTGNSRWTAQRLATLTGDSAQDISLLKSAPAVRGEAQIGLVFPVYAWGAPEPVLSFANGLSAQGAFAFAVATCGSEAGLALKKLSRVFPLDSCYSLVMPNNYIVGSDVDDPQTARRKIDAAGQELSTIAREVLSRKPVYRVKEGALPGLKSGVVNFGFNRYARSTKPFFASDACIGCGLCAERCPAGTISLKDGKPVWAQRCFQCMRCINECPQRAIQYGKSTANRGRYTIAQYEAD